MRRLHLALGAFAGSLAISVLAQTIDGQDIEEIRERSTAMQVDAEAFANHVKDRGEAFRQEARAVEQNGTANMRRLTATSLPNGPSGPVDFDEIVEGASRNAAEPAGDAPQFIVFASLSIPQPSLKQLVADTARAGGVIVFRGFPNNSAKEFVSRLSKVVTKDDMPNIGIDPRLFRAFNVDAVPTYVTVSSDFDLCAGFDCQTKVPPHDRMTGNVSVEYALSSFANRQGPGASVAAIALSNLEGRRQP